MPPTSGAPASSAAEPAKPSSGDASGTTSASGASGTAGGASGASGAYTVAAGDTLGGIARKHGVKPQDLLKWNNIENPDRIYPGQTLKLSDASS
ncbi:LysM peptidoglycan-binding domain-containing protein [Noviherbaspirillum saxi]|nr:LysM domain-containing protein [Noviherbaspirillum saxi]